MKSMRVRHFWGVLGAIGALFGDFAVSSQAQVNSWTNTPGGKWETGANWSLGAPPAITQTAVFITNAATKTVTIDATTTNFPGTMTVTGLTVSATAPDLTTLQLSNAGTGTPLRVISGINLGTNTALLVTNSAIRVEGRLGGSFIVNGSLTNLDGSHIVATNLIVGSVSGSRGNVTTLGGFLQASNLVSVGQVGGSQASLTVTGGTNECLLSMAIGQALNATGAVWVTGGYLYVRPAFGTILTLGAAGSGQLTISNGSVRALTLRTGSSQGQGTITLAGGTLTLDGDLNNSSSVGSAGMLLVAGGSLFMPSGHLAVGSGGVGQMAMNAGTLEVVQLTAGHASSGSGTITISGGKATLNSLAVANLSASTGNAWITGGEVYATNKFMALLPSIIVGRLGSGHLTISNGLLVTESAGIGTAFSGRGTLTIAGGTMVATNLTIGLVDCTATGLVAVTGGSLFVTNAAANARLLVHNGTLSIAGGFVKADLIVLTNACSRFSRSGGVLEYGMAVLDSTRDDDGDGLANGYEQSNGFDPLDANGDVDGDGITDAGELMAGTNPTNTASYFGITAIVKTNIDIRVTWITGPGKTNALERTAGVAGSYTTNDFADIFTVTNTVGTVTNYLDVSAATNSPSLYYRVRLVP